MTKKKNELSDIAKKLAKRGGQTTLKKHGKEHYRSMALKRWDKKNDKEK